MTILRRLRLENFGCFPRATLDLAPFTVLVGPGDAGKSTLLASILSYRMLAAADAAHAGDVAAALGMPALRWHRAAADARCTIAVEGAVEGAVAGDPSLPFAATTHLQADGRRARLARQELRMGDEGWSWRADTGRIAIEAGDDALEPMPGGVWMELDVDYAARSPWSEGFVEDIEALHAAQQRWLPGFLSLRRRLQGCRVFHLTPEALRAPSPPARGEEVPALGEDGAGLATVLSVLAGVARRRVDAIEEQLVAAVPWLAGFQVLPTPAGGHRLVFVLEGAPAGTRIEADQVGGGVLLLLGYLVLRHHPAPPALMLVEEPERCMHPRWLGDLAGLLRGLTSSSSSLAADAAPASQVIVTTHAPALLDAVRPEEAFFVHRGEDGAASVTRFDAIPEIDALLREAPLGALWAAHGEARLHALARGR